MSEKPIEVPRPPGDSVHYRDLQVAPPPTIRSPSRLQRLIAKISVRGLAWLSLLSVLPAWVYAFWLRWNASPTFGESPRADVEPLVWIVLAMPLLLAVTSLILAGRRHESRGVITGLVSLLASGFTFLASIAPPEPLHISAKGRLLRLSGRARLARRGKRAGWSESIEPDARGLSPVERAVVAELWHVSARLEHASVPAFSKLALQLVALGAPSSLVEACHHAALDEIDHARRCFSLASAYAETTLGAGDLPELLEARSRKRASRVDALVRLAVGSFVDGALGEGVAARGAVVAATRAADPIVRETLEVIAADEARHAELSWDVIEWCLAEGGDPVRRAIERESTGLSQRTTPARPPIPGVRDDRLESLGFLSQASLGCVIEEVTAETRRRVEGMVRVAA